MNWKLCITSLLFAAGVFADQPRPLMLEGVGVDERIGRAIDLDLTFVAENGYPVPLRSFFSSGKPVILNLVYYKCPMLCNMVLNAQAAGLREVAWTAGQEFEVVTISIDPREGFDLAQQKRGQYLTQYDRPGAQWHFLTDRDNHAKKLAEAIGFHYRYDEQIEQYAHAAAIMVLTPEGKLARYLYGVKFRSRDIRLALTEASEGRGKFSIEKILLFCYHYDPQAKSYTLFATNIMRGGGILTVLIMGILIFRMFRQERKRNLLSPTPAIGSEGNLVSAK